MDISDIISILSRGENERVEFKARPSGIAKSVCAFANSEGGVIVLGVDNKGGIIGIENAEKAMERISNEISGLSPIPAFNIEKVVINGKIIIVISVEKSSLLVSHGPIAYIRVGRSSRPLSIDEILVRAAEIRRAHFDELPSPLHCGSVNRRYIGWYLKRREEVRNVKARGRIEENIKRLKICVEKRKRKVLTYAGVLFFTEHPEEVIPGAVIRVIEMTSSGETKTIKEFYGPVWKQADDVYSFLISKTLPAVVRVGVSRKALSPYPEGAVREAIINAIVHRNYAIESDIRIFVKPHEIIIRSPGSFPPGVSVDEPEHVPRNPLLCKYMYDTGYVEKYGFGIIKMREETAAHPFCTLEISPKKAHVDVIFRQKHAGLDDIDQKIIALVHENPMRSSEIALKVGMSKVAVISRLKRLIALGVVKKIGNGPATMYLS